MSEVNIEKWVTVKEVQSYLGVGREQSLLGLLSAICLPTRLGDFGNSNCLRWMSGFVQVGRLMTTAKNLNKPQ